MKKDLAMQEKIKELEQALHEVCRNLYPADHNTPRPKFWEKVDDILSSDEFPEPYKSSPVWQRARCLYAEVERLKGNP